MYQISKREFCIVPGCASTVIEMLKQQFRLGSRSQSILSQVGECGIGEHQVKAAAEYLGANAYVEITDARNLDRPLQISPHQSRTDYKMACLS
jgi:hypothetical protein